MISQFKILEQLELQLWELKKYPKATEVYQLTVNTLCELIGNLPPDFQTVSVLNRIECFERVTGEDRVQELPRGRSKVLDIQIDHKLMLELMHSHGIQLIRTTFNFIEDA